MVDFIWRLVIGSRLWLRLGICPAGRKGVATIATNWRRIFHLRGTSGGTEQIVSRKPAQPDVTHQEGSSSKAQG